MSRNFLSFFIISAVFAYTCAGQRAVRCPIYSEPKQCGMLCEPTCEKPELIYCNPINPEMCPIEFRCIKGYVRHMGKCISVHKCPRLPQTCPRNESRSLCGCMCEATCRTADSSPRFCSGIPCTKRTAACRCNTGYLRDTTTNRCMLPKDCCQNAN